jgi:hypothetical protein
MATARRLIFLGDFSRHPLLIGLHCCFQHYKTLEAVAMATAAIVLLTPANFYHFERQKFNFQPLSFTFETFGKKLAETKINRCWGQWEENQSKKKGFNHLL